MPETVQEYSRKAAESFIQTAVFIDDRIYQQRGSHTGTIDPPPDRPRAIGTVNEANNNGIGAADGHTEDDTESKLYKIVNSFAKKKIVCSMYEPEDIMRDQQIDELVPLCTAADIVIVDWNLHGDSGAAAIELIKKLINLAIQDVPEQIRLILVYTQEIDLVDVAKKTSEAINNNIDDKFRLLPDGGDLAFHNNNSRVVVFGKPGRKRPNIDSDYVVNEDQLACTAVKEFAKLASGILQAATLLGLAEIRNNSRKILSKFGRDLDPAFLTHLAMSKPAGDALNHIVPLLVSEIESVLEDALPNPLMSDDLLKDWCMNVWKPGDHLENLFGGARREYKQIAIDICTSGFEKAREDHGIIPKLDKPAKTLKSGKFLLPSDNSDANLRFAHFMANRTFYGNKQKTLTLGSILHDTGKDQYLLCIQPVCDSVRLKEQRIFMFVKLHKTVDSSKPLSHIVVKPDNTIVELSYLVNSYHCFSATFVPDEDLKQIVAKDKDEEGFYFSDLCGSKYYWIGQLRTSHAQDAVDRFASNLSRIGLTESEWIRLLARG